MSDLFPINNASFSTPFPFVEGVPYTNIPLINFTSTPTATINNFAASMEGWGYPENPALLTIIQTGKDLTTSFFQIQADLQLAQTWGASTLDPIVNITTTSGTNVRLVHTEDTGYPIQDAILYAGESYTFRAIEGVVYLFPIIASFTDSNPYGTISDYFAHDIIINWGDGSSDNITPDHIVSGNGSSHIANGVLFNIIGVSHTYTEEGEYGVIITIISNGSSTINLSATVIVSDAQLTALLVQPILQGNIINGRIVGFTDENVVSTLDDFTGTIDWDDGKPTSIGNFTQPGGIGTDFYIEQHHIYKKNGIYTPTINIIDKGGETLTIRNTVTVQVNYKSGQFEINMLPIYMCHKKTFDGYIARVSDLSNNYLPPSQFTATINWGDKITTVGIIELTGIDNNSQYLIRASHKYCEKGKYMVEITFSQTGGNRIYDRELIEIY